MGAQLVAISCQTFVELGWLSSFALKRHEIVYLEHTINHVMFQRYSRTSYALKPNALQSTCKVTKHFLKIKIISAQQLLHAKDGTGRKIVRGIADPFVEVFVFVLSWAVLCPLRSPSSNRSTTSEESRIRYIPGRATTAITAGYRIPQQRRGTNSGV
jgi:hypothetical protein